MIYCEHTTPPVISNLTLSSTVSVIYVPIGSAEGYKTATGWRNYATKIKEYDFE